MKNGRYDTKVGGWERLLAAVRASEQILSVAEPLSIALEFHLQEVKEAKARQLQHRAGSHRATQELQERSAICQDVAIRLQSLVKSQLGTRDERLPQFGIATRRKRTRKSLSSPPPQATPDSTGPEPGK
jgi:hypothetical protein